MQLNKKWLVYLYIPSMVIAFTTRYGDFLLKSNYFQLAIGLLWIAIAFLQVGINRFHSRGHIQKECFWFVKIYFVPHLVIHLYTFFLILTGNISWKYFSTNLTVYIPTLLAISSIYLFGTKALKYNFIALVGSWILSIGTSLLAKGWIIFPQAIIQAYIGDTLNGWNGSTVNYLELHDLVMAIGYILVFYLINKKYNKQECLYVLIAIVIMALGMKRISLLGIILAIVFYSVIKRRPAKKQYRICLTAGLAGFIVCYLFVWILSEGSAFYNLASRFGINLMGRNYYYKAIMDMIPFKFSFMGLGRNAVSRLFASDLSYLKVGGVHSDILKMYAENGFILFGVWLWYYLLHVTKQYKKHFGYSEALVYFLMAVYAFTLYLTDNTEVYYICQMFQIILPAVYALERQKHSMIGGKVKQPIDSSNKALGLNY